MGTLVFSVRNQRLFELNYRRSTFQLVAQIPVMYRCPVRGLVVNTVRLVGEDTDGCSPTHRSTAHLWERKKLPNVYSGYGSSFQIGPYTVSLQETTNSAAETVSVFSPKHHEFIAACDEALVIERSILEVVYGPDKGKEIFTYTN